MNFKDLIGFIEQGMNWAASHLVSRKELCQTVENVLKGGKGVEKDSISKECIVSGKVTLLRAFWVDNLTSADQKISG